MIRPERMIADDFDGREMYRSFLAIAWPALVESVLLGVINFVDTLMVSSLGEISIAAVGLTTQPRLLFYAILLAFSIGINSVVARRRGQGNREGANRVLSQTLPLVFLAALLFFAIGWIASDPLLRLAGAENDTIGEAISYFRITMLGMVFTSVSLSINAAQRGCGKTRISMVTNLSANIVNVIFNALLIHGLLFFPRLGVTGAAIATALGNFVSMAISLVSVRKRDGYLFLRLRSLLSLRYDSLKPVFTVASGTLIEQVFMRIGFFTFAKIVAELGTMEFATHQICMTVLNLVFTFGEGLSVATSSLIGQNLGKRRPDRALVYGKVGQRIGWGFSAVILISFIILRRGIVGLFTDDPSILEVGAIIVIIEGVVALFQIQQLTFSGSLRGAGDTRFMALVSLVSIAIIRPLVSYILCYPAGLGVIGAWIGVLVDQIIRFIFSATRFYSQKWCKIEL